jgi:hypothetical protein
MDGPRQDLPPARRSRYVADGRAAGAAIDGRGALPVVDEGASKDEADLGWHRSFRHAGWLTHPTLWRRGAPAIGHSLKPAGRRG